MRRNLLRPLIAAGALLFALMPGTALAMPTGGGDAANLATTTTAAPATVRHANRILLGCALVRYAPDSVTKHVVLRAGIAPAIKCRWSAIRNEKVHAYQLWRIVDAPGGRPRQLIATIPAGEPMHFLDRHVANGHTYLYRVIAIAEDGTKLARSNRDFVKVPRHAAKLRMACALATIGDKDGVICKWSGARHPRAARYVLIRSVDGAAREAIYRTGRHGFRTFFDKDVEAGQTIRYAVVVKNKHGRVIGLGGPVVVTIPTPAAVPSAAPTDG